MGSQTLQTSQEVLPEPRTRDEDPTCLSLLLLCDWRTDGAATVRDHITALSEGSRHRVFCLSVFGDLPARLDLAKFDGVVLHYSVCADLDAFLSASARRVLGGYRGLKAVFIQDEHRNVGRRIEDLREIGTHILFTCVSEDQTANVYPEERLPNVRKINVLAGYVPSRLISLDVPPLAERPIDVGYRARELPAWLGELAREKSIIGRRFLADAARYGLVCDISHWEEDRLYGAEWIKFLTRCKATLGVESGASVFDPDGTIQARVEAHRLRDPGASFEELQALYFRDEDGRVLNNQISPRHFEAACVRTLMILYRGHYSGILIPRRHYVPLEKDHSNMEEVVAVLRDSTSCQRIVNDTHAEIACNPAYGYAALTQRVDEAVCEVFAELGLSRTTPYDTTAWPAITRPSLGYRRRRLQRSLFEFGHRLAFRGLKILLSESMLERIRIRLKALRARLQRAPVA